MNEITTDQTEATPLETPTGDAQTPVESTEATAEVEGTPDAVESDVEDPETFPREYVVKLRKESAGHRERAKRSDDLAARLHTALVSASGKLADPSDLPFDEAHLEDPAALDAAVETLLASKPHLASRKPVGNIGQGVTPVSHTVSLGGLLRSGAN